VSEENLDWSGALCGLDGPDAIPLVGRPIQIRRPTVCEDNARAINEPATPIGSLQGVLVSLPLEKSVEGRIAITDQDHVRVFQMRLASGGKHGE